MNIIESALNAKNKSEDLTEEVKSVAARKRDPRTLGSARNQIATMVQSRIFSPEEFAEKGLIFSAMKDSTLLNKYRNLRTKLLASTSKHNFITLITSVVPGGGTSLVAANLAAAFSLDEGKTSLLINADVNEKQLDSLFDVEYETGLIDYLESDDDAGNDKIIFETPVPRLRYVPIGKARVNTAEYFTSDKMKSFMQDVVLRYSERYPIIDAPCINTSADTRILLELCDKAILVIPYGICTEEEIKAAVQALGKDKFAGVVLNEF